MISAMAAGEDSDIELVRRIGAGDDAAFSVFYRRHLGAVIAFLYRRLGDRELAFDLAAETFAAVVVGAGSYEPTGPAAAWLYGIARNKLRESLRRHRVEQAARRRLRMEPIALEDSDLARVEELAGSGEEALARALEALPEATRAALLARIVEERDYEDIASRLQCSEQVVRQRVHRGLGRLRTEIKGQA
jgi:RNA polymerase sigma factor (sigma-70 family)